VLFEPEGVDREGRAAARGAAAQRAVAAHVIGVPLLASCSRIPLHELIERVIRKRGGAAVVRATRDVAEGVITARVDCAAQIAASGANRIEPGQLVRVIAIAVEILVVARAVEWSLPELAQVRVGVAAAVACAIKPTGERAGAAGADARCWLRPRVARPHQPVLFVITEILGVAATGAALSWHRCERCADAGNVAHRVIATTLAEDGATGAAATLPGGARRGRTQVAIVGEMIVGKLGARRGLEVDVADAAGGIVAQRRQIRHSRGVVREAGEQARGAIVGVGEGVTRLSAHGGLRGHQLIGVVVCQVHLIGRQRRGDVPTARHAQLQRRAAQPSPLVVLALLRRAR